MFCGQHLLPQETAEGNVELCLGGAERLVTEENKLQYVETRTAVDEGEVKGRMGKIGMGATKRKKTDYKMCNM